MLVQSDTARISIRRFDPIIHKEIFREQKINTNNQLLFSSNFDFDLNEIQEVKFLFEFDDSNNEDCNDEAQLETIEDEKQVTFYKILKIK